MKQSLTYSDAGVDIDKAGQFVDVIKKIANQTPRSGVMGEIGGFGGLFSLNLANIKQPVLVSSTDGVGTKLKIAFMMNKHDTVGIDLVAMCVNDIAVQGATPLFFLDYLAMGKLETQIATDIIHGISKGCIEANCSLIGGETAEMPGFYQDNEYDLAGFTVGIVDSSNIIDGTKIKAGHKLIGIASSGLHSNGYSLVRKICFDVLKLKIDDYVDHLGKTIGEEILTPTKIYSNTILGLIKNTSVYGLAHITGGGITENTVRIIPETCKVLIYKGSWDVPAVFTFLQDSGEISDMEMMRTFNSGIGLIAVVKDNDVQKIIDHAGTMNEKAFLIGEVAERKPSESQIQWV